MKTSPGSKLHSEVRYAGAPAGRVIGMRHLSAAQRVAEPDKKDAVRVSIELLDSVPPLPADVTASLSSDTLLSPKFVALSAGTPGKTVLPNNAIIRRHARLRHRANHERARPGPDNANKLIDNLNGTVKNLDGTVTSVKGDLGLLLPKLSPVADIAKVDLEELQKTIQGLNGMEAKASNLFSTADTFVGSTDQKLSEQMRELRVILLNLKVITTHAKALVEALAEKPNRIIFSGKAKKLTPEDEIIKSSQPLPAKQP